MRRSAHPAMTSSLTRQNSSANRRPAAAARSHPHDRKAALVGAVGAEAEQAVDAGEARRIGQHFRREALRRLGFAPAPRPARPRHRPASRCAPARRRIWRGSGRRNCGSRPDPARRKGRPAAPGCANTRGLSHRPVPSSWMFLRFAPAAVSASAIPTTASPSSARNSASACAERLRHVAGRRRRDRRRISRTRRCGRPCGATACLNAASTTLP